VKGSRVQMIVRELENEKIDIVPFTTNIRQFITSALVPAHIQSIDINEANKTADVVVKQGELSLAIGKRGQNAKLAARLTGWKLDIHSEGEEEKMSRVDVEQVQHQYLEDFLTQIERATPELQNAIYNSNFNSVQQLAEASPTELSELIGEDLSFAEEIVEGAQEYLEALREMTRSNYGDDDFASANTAVAENQDSKTDSETDSEEEADDEAEDESEDASEEESSEVNDSVNKA